MRSRLVICVLLLAGGMSCSGPTLQLPADRRTSMTPPATPSPAAQAMAAGGVITASTPAGEPRFIRALGAQTAAPGSTPAEAARAHFARYAGAYGIAGDALAGTEVAGVGRTPKGDYLVHLAQRVNGMEIYRSEVKVVMRADLSLVALTGSPSNVTGAKPAQKTFNLTAGQALTRALIQIHGVMVPEAMPTATVAASSAYTWLDLPPSSPVRLSQPARAKPVYFRSGGGLLPAYFIEVFSGMGASSTRAYRALVSADDGRLLERHDLTHDAAFNYRVFAEPTGERRPFDGPIADYTPHPTGMPDGSDPAFVPPQLVSVESLKTLPPGLVDPWLPAGAVQTLGNNIDAYADRGMPDGFSNGDLRATITSPGTFDRVYDVTKEATSSEAQIMASVTNLFFLTNWQHDYWYDSGFDEVAGNAQASNYGRGGQGGDPIHAEAQDFGGTNNANMSTPSDGLSPRMQMYLWDPPSKRSLTIEPGPKDVVTSTAAFGAEEFDVTAAVVLASDGTPPLTDGCDGLSAADVTGKIVIIDRGACSFVIKAQNAQLAGAAGVLIANNVPGGPIGMADSVPPSALTVPVMGISQDDGIALKALLGGEAAVTAHMLLHVQRPGRDGSLDTMIVSHEWGHYFHHRLSDCNSPQCDAMSEGWADFIALHTVLREGDNLNGTYGAAIYAPKNFGDSGYFGIRRYPYSVDFTKNALTFGDISNEAVLPKVPTNANGVPNSEAHNAGEVWASMLFEAYVALQKNPAGRTFNEVRRSWGNDLVLGLQLAPIDATYTETRDAILTAVSMNTPSDLPVVAAAFARRGAGSCAISPPVTASDDLAPVTESFAIQPNLALTAVKIDDKAEGCDDDGILDGGETGNVTVTVANTSPGPVAGTTVVLSTATPGVTFPDGASVAVPAIPAFGTATVTLHIAAAATITGVQLLALNVAVNNATACVPSLSQEVDATINADEVRDSSTIETAEETAPPWKVAGAGAATIWARSALSATEHVLYGQDKGAQTDTQLVSPPLVVGSGELHLDFDQIYSFETDGVVFFDGGVIELSSDGGATWQDISTLANPGYTAAALESTSGNPLGGRAAFGGANAAFPAFEHVSLNLGATLAGKTVLVRFRIGTDDAVNDLGWIIDNFAVTGTTNKPFTSVVPHAGSCQEPPDAIAGKDRTVQAGDDVLLDASGSTDPNHDPLTFAWSQTTGPAVTIFNPNQVVAAFRAPRVKRSTLLIFQVAASDGRFTSFDIVKIRVRP
jgi:hypothetical protein